MTIQPSKASVPPSTIEPLPYFPNLKSQLRGVTASLVLTYLEIHHPAPRDSNGTILAGPGNPRLGRRCSRSASVPQDPLRHPLSTLYVVADEKRLEVAQPAPAVSFSILTTPATAAGSSTPQQARKHGAWARLFGFGATSRHSLVFCRKPEFQRSRFQFLYSLSQFPNWPTAPFQRPLPSRPAKKNRKLRFSCAGACFRVTGGAHVIRGYVRL